MRAVILATLTVALAGCATITRGTTEVLVIESEPPGADVEVSPAGLRCKTPCSLELKRKSNYMVQIQRDGYEPVKVNVLSQIAGAGAAGMAGNVILGGLIGAGIDAASGATKKLTPNPIKVNLVPLAPAPAVAAPTATPVAPSAAQATTQAATFPAASAKAPAAEPGATSEVTSPPGTASGSKVN